MINTITGELKIFTKEVETKKGERVIFNACVGSTKDSDGKYLNYYMPVNFAKALRKDIAKVYQNESFDVTNIEAWIKAYRDKDENVRPILFINKCDVVTDAEEKKTTKGKAKTASKSKQKMTAIEDDDLPF